MKYDSMLVPTPIKAEISGKISFSETIEIEYEDQDSIKIPRLDSGKELVESKGKRIKEKGKVQGPFIQIQEYSFAEA